MIANKRQRKPSGAGPLHINLPPPDPGLSRFKEPAPPGTMQQPPQASGTGTAQAPTNSQQSSYILEKEILQMDDAFKAGCCMKL
jgi:hypothetical protein